jgi:hypothetical protein
VKPDEKIARLEGMLDRVRRNAAQPRVRAPSAPHEEAEPERPIDGHADAAPALLEETAVVEVGEPIAAIDIDDAGIEVEELDLTEEELVDLTEPESLQPPPPEPLAEPPSIDWEEVEEPPASSRRPIAAESIDAALQASPEVALDEGREIPLKTPPPESGPQAAPPYIPPAAEIPLDAEPLSEGDIESTGSPLRADEPLFEMSEPAAIEVAEPEPPPPPVVHEAEAAWEPGPESGEVAPDVVRRPAVQAAAPSAYVAAVRGFRPSSFVELLDASLGLGD